MNSLSISHQKWLLFNKNLCENESHQNLFSTDVIYLPDYRGSHRFFDDIIVAMTYRKLKNYALYVNIAFKGISCPFL